MRKIRLSRWAKRSVRGLAVLGGAAWGVIFFYPLQLAELSNRYDLWREGVHEVNSGGLHGYMQDRCEGTANPSKDCSCVALIHGLADNAMTWKKILLWPANGWLRPVKLFAWDLPGSGDSAAPTHPEQGYRVRNQARALREAMAPQCKQWLVVGNSLGGWVAAWLALDWPEGVDKLVLVDSSGLKSSADPTELQAFMNPTVESLKDFQRRAYFKGRPLPENIWRAAVSRMKNSNARQILQAQTPEDYLDGKITTLRKPTFLLWGQADQLIPVSAGQMLKSQIPGAIWIEAPQCGHLPQKECPLEVIRTIARMIDFGAV